jgi:predicted glycogen debranching enzyme
VYRLDIDPADPASIDRALRTEWLLTNGLGGFAMGTALGVNTRRYHGLLIAATRPPVGRILALHSMIEQLVIPRDEGSEEVIDLSTQQFVGPDGEPLLHPGGWRYLIGFESEPNGFSWTWSVRGITIDRFLNNHPGRNVVLTHYGLEGAAPGVRLRVRPLIALRDFHGLEHERSDSPIVTALQSGFASATHDLRLEVELIRQGAADMMAEWLDDPQWWRGFAYSADRDRGQDWREDLWSPGVFEGRCASRQGRLSLKIELKVPWREDRSHPGRVSEYFIPPNEPQISLSRLKWAAKDFLVSRIGGDEASVSVIAGYPWFADWGRDAMISLPGLMLCTGRFDDARSTLLNFAGHMQRGLIPNCFHDSGTVEHNTVDASLWFIHAVRSLHAASPRHVDDALLAACREIVAAYQRGTDHGIHMDPKDGLIVAGDASTQLTWMDAKRDGVAFTPRHGKAVEINALWFNALRCLAAMTDDETERRRLSALADRVAASFRAQFWWPQRACLHDVLAPLESGAGYAASGDQLRPNQIFAASLPHSPLTRDQQRAVVNVVGERLLTPFGLRTLDRDDPAYRSRYEGDMWQRDSSYHQGTVWPWLIGPYCEAMLRANDFSAAAKAEARRVLQPLLGEMSNTQGGRCLGQIAEVYDGDEPHRPSGCPAQAWSVAEVLRALTLIEGEAHVH